MMIISCRTTLRMTKSASLQTTRGKESGTKILGRSDKDFDFDHLTQMQVCTMVLVKMYSYFDGFSVFIGFFNRFRSNSRKGVLLKKRISWKRFSHG
jgi:hypothetical protein